MDERLEEDEEFQWEEACPECVKGKKEAQMIKQMSEVESLSTATPSSSATPSPSPSPSPLYCSSIWLHCYSYSGPHWSYTAPLPEWAQEGFDSAAAMREVVSGAASAVDPLAEEGV
jgi:hypothetical protein